MTSSVGSVSLGALLDHAAARAVLARHLPGVTGSAHLEHARGLALESVLTMAGGQVPVDLMRTLEADLADALGDDLPALLPQPPRPFVDKQRLTDIQIRDPFVLTTDREYYLFGSTDRDIWHPPAIGFDCYRSTDLEHWEGPIPAFRPPAGFWSDRNFWAPEVHAYAGAYYMFATFKAQDVARGTQVLRAEHPQGPYEPHSDGPVTPEDWECLDGTLHVDAEGQPWIVFCHEWEQVVDGQVVAQRLAPDLVGTIGEPIVLFQASAATWTQPLRLPRRPGEEIYVTDGPFLHRLASGVLLMLWSSFGAQGYAMGIARSASGTVLGPWVHEAEPLWAEDGGHGMIGRTLDGDLFLTLHQPNRTPDERAVFRRLSETDTTVRLAAYQPAGGADPNVAL